MDKKTFLLGVLEKLQYQDSEAFDNTTNALTGLVEAAGDDEQLLALIEQIIQSSITTTMSSLRQSNMEELLSTVQRMRQQEDIDSSELDDILAKL